MPKLPSKGSLKVKVQEQTETGESKQSIYSNVYSCRCRLNQGMGKYVHMLGV